VDSSIRKRKALASVRYSLDGAGRVQIESKEQARKRGIKSADRAERGFQLRILFGGSRHCRREACLTCRRASRQAAPPRYIKSRAQMCVIAGGRARAGGQVVVVAPRLGSLTPADFGDEIEREKDKCLTTRLEKRHLRVFCANLRQKWPG
jgi:hypothetical protein